MSYNLYKSNKLKKLIWITKSTLFTKLLMLKSYQKPIKYVFYNFLSINMTNNYYQKHKEKLRKEAYERYENLFEEKK